MLTVGVILLFILAIGLIGWMILLSIEYSIGDFFDDLIDGLCIASIFDDELK